MSRPHVRQFGVIFVVSMATALSALAGPDTIIYVDDDAPPGGDGRSWETAYRYLQDALPPLSYAARAKSGVMPSDTRRPAQPVPATSADGSQERTRDETPKPLRSPRTEAEKKRIARVKKFLSSIEGESPEPLIFRLIEGGYIKRASAKGSSWFAMPTSNYQDVVDKADAFLEYWSDLVADESPLLTYPRIEVKKSRSKVSRYIVQYKQMYKGIEVYGGMINVCANAEGQIGSLGTDILRNIQPLESGRVSLQGKMTSREVKRKAIAWMKKKHAQARFKATSPEQVIFAPVIFSMQGGPRLAWSLNVVPRETPWFLRLLGRRAKFVSGEFAIVDDNSGDVIYHYPLAIVD